VQHIVRLEPGVPYDRVPAEIAAADACVVPVNRDVFTDDILPVKLLEAVAMQRPVIASRISNIERHFDDRAICYCTPGDVGDLARCLRTVATDAKYRQRLVAEAGRQAQPYRWARVKPHYLAAIAGLIQAPVLRRRASLVDAVGVPGSVHDESVS
jgi:glycosyltransferase involved in cell wall biosynthesis